MQEAESRVRLALESTGIEYEVIACDPELADTAAFCAALPSTVKGVAVLDRTKEPGAIGEPLSASLG